VHSNIQTRTLTDSLNRVDELLNLRNSRLRESEHRKKLAGNFSPHCYPDFFHSWAFSAEEHKHMTTRITEIAPELAGTLKQPRSNRDFTVVGHCSLYLSFFTDPNGAYQVEHRLADGTPVSGARVIAGEGCVFENGLVRIPAEKQLSVHFYQPEAPVDEYAAGVAVQALEGAGSIVTQGVELTFPEARTKRLPRYDWVSQLKSENGLYEVKSFISSGDSFVDQNGFFSRETQIVQMEFLSEPEEYAKTVIDRPFVVFFADNSGVQAATWFGRDAFNPMAV